MEVGRYLQGDTGGQDDVVDIKAASGEYVIPADVVAHAGDGNNEAGGKKFDHLVLALRKLKGAKNKLPPKTKNLLNYLK